MCHHRRSLFNEFISTDVFTFSRVYWMIHIMRQHMNFVSSLDERTRKKGVHGMCFRYSKFNSSINLSYAKSCKYFHHLLRSNANSMVYLGSLRTDTVDATCHIETWEKIRSGSFTNICSIWFSQCNNKVQSNFLYWIPIRANLIYFSILKTVKSRQG